LLLFGLQATLHDDCDCMLGIATRKELHDLYGDELMAAPKMLRAMVLNIIPKELLLIGAVRDVSSSRMSEWQSSRRRISLDMQVG